ncbi:MAG TPA: terminase small subunit, partial [Quisquiliibacterium sp.]|nr:terminase small subunit [Quisquiliibacterium sp.]
TGVTADRVISELARIAFGNQRAVMRWGAGGVTLRESSELTDDEAALVSEVAETVSAAGGGLKLKTHDKVKALELLGKHLGMFVDKVEHSGAIAGGLAERMAAARQRAGA